MRLTCPNCGAAYDVAMGLVPAGGSHVQCSACHTRWFARPEAAPPAQTPSEDEIIARLDARAQRPRLASAAGVPPRGAASSETIAFPAAARRAAPPAPAADDPEPTQTPLRPRAAPERMAPAAAQYAGTEIEPRSRFGLGFVLALAVGGAALGVYLRAEDLARAAPAAAPYLDAYAARVDLARDWAETRLGPARDQALGAVFPEG